MLSMHLPRVEWRHKQHAERHPGHANIPAPTSVFHRRGELRPNDSSPKHTNAVRWVALALDEYEIPPKRTPARTAHISQFRVSNKAKVVVCFVQVAY